jgi:CubicO group peptidase (beta-lactamase class C family)
MDRIIWQNELRLSIVWVGSVVARPLHSADPSSWPDCGVSFATATFQCNLLAAYSIVAADRPACSPPNDPLRSTMRHVASVALLSLVVVVTVVSCDSTSLDRYVLHEKNQADIIGMQVGYVGPDEREWHGSYGLKNYKTGASVNDSTLFMIASSAKPVTALAILKLHDDGKLRLDDDVSRYLPFSVVNPHSPDASITFRMLLSHTGTVQDNWEVMDPLYTLKKGETPR